MEAKVFTQDKVGIKIHWTLEGAEVIDLTAGVADLLVWLEVNGFKADNGFGNGSSTQARPAATAPHPAAHVAQSAGPSGVAEWRFNQDGSRTCSVHGLAKWVPPGTSPRTGKSYTGFWACKSDGCKPKGDD